jgi:ABC-type uncharacterized transport system involved in gliding motility auxiliary subunit
MKIKPVDLLAPVGFAVVIGSWIADRLNKHLPGTPRTWMIIGAGLVLTHILMRWDNIVRAIGGRQLRYGANALVLVALVAGILGGINFLGFRHSTRWDFTKNQRYSLSDQTRKIAAGLGEDVHITYFQQAAQMAQAQDRLKQYESLSPKLKLEFVDPLRSPAKARLYDISQLPTLVLERGDKREKITNDSEQEITNALIKVTRSGKKTVCFAGGEGERTPDDSSEKGLSAAKSNLEKSNYATKKVDLLGETQIPADCTVTIVGGPQKDLVAKSADALRQYIKGGGKALILLEPELKEAQPNLDALLKEWNIEAGKNVVVDFYGEAAGLNVLAALGRRYPFHEITRDFAYGSVFFLSRTVEAGKQTLDGVTAQNLVETSPNATDARGQTITWATTETDLKKLADPRFDAKRDRAGPLPLAAVATVRVPQPTPSPSPSPGAPPEPEAKKAEGRVVAMGDSDFASNALLGMPGVGNLDLFMNTVAWLSQDVDLISIRPKEADDQRMMLSENQRLAVTLFSLLGLPVAFLVLGVVAWWVRR